MLGVSVNQLKRITRTVKGEIASSLVNTGASLVRLSQWCATYGPRRSEHNMSTMAEQKPANPDLQVWRDVERAARASLTGANRLNGTFIFLPTGALFMVELA